MNPAPPSQRRRLVLLEATSLVAILAVGAGARLLPWDQVYTPSGVRFSVDADPLYHVLRMKRALESWPQIALRDAGLDYPHGAAVLWPPLFDFSGAAAARLLSPGAPDPAALERIAVAVPVAWALLGLLLVALLGRALLGGGLWLEAVLFCAVLPATVRFGTLGRVDQHVAEQAVFLLVLLAFVLGLRARRARAARVGLGFALALSFWTWQGAAFYLGLVAAATAGWHVLARPGDEDARRMSATLGVGAALAAALLALSVGTLTPPGTLAQMKLSGISGFPAVLCALVAAFAGALWLARTRRPGASLAERVATTAFAGLACLAPLALPALRAPMQHGLSTLAASGAWQATISEHRAFFSTLPVAQEIPYRLVQWSLVLPIAPAVALALALRRKPSTEPAVHRFLLVFLVASLLALTFTSNRFALYALPIAALATARGVRAVAERITTGRLGKAGQRFVPLTVALGTLLVLSPTLAAGPTVLRPRPSLPEPAVALLRELGAQAPVQADRPAVLARWPWGHALQYYAGKPVVTSPFGTDAGAHSLEDWGAVAFSRDEGEVEAVLARRRVGFLLLGDWSDTLAFDRGFAPPGALSRAEDGEHLLLSRLFDDDGSARPGLDEAGLGHFRRLFVGDFEASGLKAFAWVPGCQLEVTELEPGVVATAQVAVAGARQVWATRAKAGPDGKASLLLPYPGEYQVEPRAGSGGTVAVGEDCVAGRTRLLARGAAP